MLVVMTTALFSASLLSCGDDESEEIFITAETSEECEFAAVGGKRTIRVKSNTEWTAATQVIEGANDWLTTNITTGKGNQDLVVTASANTTISARKAIVKIYCVADPSKSWEFTYTQVVPEPSLKVSKTSVSLKALDRKPASIKIESNVAWTVSFSEEWLSVDKSKGEGTANINFSAEDNIADVERTAIVTITADEVPELSQTITVKQSSTANLLYREPLTTWNSSASEVKSYMADYNLNIENATQLIYEGKFKEIMTGYLFEDSKLKNAIVAVQSSYASSSDIEQSLKDNGYNAEGTDRGGRKKFVSDNRTTIVLIDLNTENNVYFIRYYDPDIYNKLFAEPYVSWEASRSSVKNIMSSRGYTLEAESTKASEDYYLIYKAKYWEEGSVYYFDASMCLIMSAVVFNESVINKSLIEKFLKSDLNYTYYLTNNGYTYYKTKNDNIVVSVYNKDSYVYVVYFNPNNASGSRSQNDLFSESTSILNSSQHIEQIRRITEKWKQHKGTWKTSILTPMIKP